ncbi:MAG TPA: ABC transporter permease [Acidimicrobiia bacterium]|nr:ABC transporter permease [Acidimicrobiia bacterium]
MTESSVHDQPMTQGEVAPDGTGGGREPQRRRSATLYLLLKGMNGRILVGSFMLFFVLVIAVFAPLIATQDPLAIDAVDRLLAPGADHWFGTDELGRDVFSRVIYGSRISVMVGMSVVVTTTVLGTVIGLAAGFYRKLDGVFMRIMDAFQSFPSILLAIAIMAALGASARNVIIALTITNLPKTARVVRGRVLGIREETYIESARAVGLGDIRIMRRYVLPNTLAPLIVQATFILALAIIAEAGLSFIGAGTPPPAPSWGNILAAGRGYMRQAQWITLFPGVFIMISVLSLNILGDGLRDVLDPRLKDRR